jgi:hypothetical protein
MWNSNDATFESYSKNLISAYTDEVMSNERVLEVFDVNDSVCSVFLVALSLEYNFFLKMTIITHLPGNWMEIGCIVSIVNIWFNKASGNLLLVDDCFNYNMKSVEFLVSFLLELEYSNAFIPLFECKMKKWLVKMGVSMWSPSALSEKEPKKQIPGI